MHVCDSAGAPTVCWWEAEVEVGRPAGPGVGTWHHDVTVDVSLKVGHVEHSNESSGFST
jgi:hypothetical protein